MYLNFGAFFAKLGFVTVVPDYRLVPDVQFPTGTEDVRDALIYVLQNVTEADTNRVYLLGHSAGSVHMSTLLFSDDILQSGSAQTIFGGGLRYGLIWPVVANILTCPIGTRTVFLMEFYRAP